MEGLPPDSRLEPDDRSQQLSRRRHPPMMLILASHGIDPRFLSGGFDAGQPLTSEDTEECPSRLHPVTPDGTALLLRTETVLLRWSRLAV
jgi:hypothetical protein